jgi:hypothetical protein
MWALIIVDESEKFGFPGSVQSPVPCRGDTGPRFDVVTKGRRAETADYVAR